MAKQEKSVHKKSRGRPPGRIYAETIPVRLAPEMIAAVDKWAIGNNLSRSNAIRLLIGRALKKQ